MFEIKSKCPTVNWQKSTVQVSPLIRRECLTKSGVMYLWSKCFALGWKHCCIEGLVKLK